jgi:glycosyltransferase involved in cell wall biosynthesis
MPWEYPYEWDKPAQRHLYLDFFDRLRADARLRDHVVFDEFSPDIASWLRGIGTVLSPSVDEFESFHLAPAEGMASGAAAVFWDREGVDELFGGDLIASTLAEARDRILELRSAETRERVSRSARERVAQWDVDELSAAWSEALTPVAAAPAPAHRASRVG